MRGTRLLLALATTAVAVSGVRAQVPTSLDLAIAKPNDTIIVPRGTYVIRVTDMLPSARYQITTSLSRQEIAPMPSGAAPTFAPGPPNCRPFSAAVDSLRSARAEEALPRLLAGAQALAGSSAPMCTDADTLLTSLVRQMTKDSVATYRLGGGEYVRVDVTRPAQRGLAERRWQLIISTGPRGEWQTTYGFGIPVYIGGQHRFSAHEAGAMPRKPLSMRASALASVPRLAAIWSETSPVLASSSSPGKSAV